MSTPSAELTELLSSPSFSNSRSLTLARPTEAQSLFYGWVILPLAFLMMLTTTPGQTYGISYFNEAFIAEFGMSKTVLSATYLLATLLAATGLTFIGALVDRWGLRRMTLYGFTAMGLSCVFAAEATGTISLFIAFTFLRLFGPGTMTLLANNSLAAWFDCRLGTASSAAQITMAAATAFIPGGILLAIESVGWRGTYLLYGAIIVGGFLPLMAIFFRQCPRELGQVPDGMRFQASQRYKPFSYGNEFTVAESMQHRSYWILMFTTSIWAAIGTALIFHLVGLCQANGFTVQDSTQALMVMALATATTQLVGGMLADYLAMRYLLAAAMGMLCIACMKLADPADMSELLFGYGVFGLAQGLISVVGATVWARYFGRTHLGKIRGISLTAAVAASAIGPVIMSISADYLGGFGQSLWLFTVLSAMCAIVSFWATAPQSAEVADEVLTRPIAA
jgi:MFS family permease